MVSLSTPELDPRMVRTADALLSVAETLLTLAWPPPGGDITGFLRKADLSITSVEAESGRITTSGGLAGTCTVLGSELAAVTFTFDRLRADQLGLAAVIADWFTARFGPPFDSGIALPHSRRWQVGAARVVLDRQLEPEPRVVLQICRDEETTELGAVARAMVTAARVLAQSPRPAASDQVAAWFARAGIRQVDEPGQGLVVWTTRRLAGHWTGGDTPDEVYLTAHGEPGWLDQLARSVHGQVVEYLGPPTAESQDPDDGTRLAEWQTTFAQVGVLRSPVRGIAGIFVTEPEIDSPTPDPGE